MRAANNGHALTVVLVLLAFGIALSFAGYHYRGHQQAKQITWQDVNVTLQDVEGAKQDLFRSLNAKSGI